ncbi:HpcH/HpaI aldolase/citrate lyase family protein [Pacificoceanicola onchidii]|uniref:HpcH/HpaI aldolase/citrate lyase family protein n=1 Tax=Pacificoceanicola onchidii TaxID=2562685 RepID=UPI0010A5D15D|nr:CoA ester lyase [Pacificoceanicola onchidii]
MWRSLLFIPVLEERFVAKAAKRGADAVILDLEASIAEADKPNARAALPDAVARLAPHVDVTVRINPTWLPAIRDLEACVLPRVSALHMALCESAEQVRAVDGIVTELERERGLPEGGIALIAMLESPAAVLNAPDIARSSPRMAALTLGVEDYATAMGTEPSDALLQPAGYQVIQAARSAGLDALVVPASIADFRDLDSMASAAQAARALGSTGGYAVHPGQVAVLNRCFAPTPEELHWAERVVAASASGDAVFKLDGKMIDKPLIERAKRQLQASR